MPIEHSVVTLINQVASYHVTDSTADLLTALSTVAPHTNTLSPLPLISSHLCVPSSLIFQLMFLSTGVLSLFKRWRVRQLMCYLVAIVIYIVLSNYRNYVISYSLYGINCSQSITWLQLCSLIIILGASWRFTRDQVNYLPKCHTHVYSNASTSMISLINVFSF